MTESTNTTLGSVGLSRAAMCATPKTPSMAEAKAPSAVMLAASASSKFPAPHFQVIVEIIHAVLVTGRTAPRTFGASSQSFVGDVAGRKIIATCDQDDVAERKGHSVQDRSHICSPSSFAPITVRGY